MSACVVNQKKKLTWCTLLFNRSKVIGIRGKHTLTHWGLVTHICVRKLTVIASDNGLSPERRQAIIWTNAGIMLIGPLGTNFSDFFVEIQTFSLKKIRLKMSSAKCCSFRVGLNVLTQQVSMDIHSLMMKITHTRTPRDLNQAIDTGYV